MIDQASLAANEISFGSALFAVENENWVRPIWPHGGKQIGDDQHEIALMHVQEWPQRVNGRASLGKRQCAHSAGAPELYGQRLDNRPSGRRDPDGVPVAVTQIEKEVVASSDAARPSRPLSGT